MEIFAQCNERCRPSVCTYVVELLCGAGTLLWRENKGENDQLGSFTWTGCKISIMKLSLLRSLRSDGRRLEEREKTGLQAKTPPRINDGELTGSVEER